MWFYEGLSGFIEAVGVEIQGCGLEKTTGVQSEGLWEKEKIHHMAPIMYVILTAYLESGAEGVWYIRENDIPHQDPENGKPNATLRMNALPTTSFPSIIL